MSPRKRFSAVCLAALAIAPLPVSAHDSVPTAVGEDLAGKLADPRNQIAATVALTALSEMLLDLRIEPFRRAMATIGDENAADLPPDARLRDLAGPDAEDLPGEIGRRVPRTMGAAAGMIGSFQDLMPELRATIDRMKRALPEQ